MDLPANVAIAQYDWRTLANPGAELHYITTEDTANERIARIASRSTPFAIGLDFEWRPTFTAGRPENPIALVQVACDDEILLVQVGAMQGFPTGLRNLLESANSTKVGVGIQYDCKKLWKDHRVSVRNCVDLALLARSVDNERWKGPYKGGIGLIRLVNVYLGQQLVKGGIQRSDWDRELTTRQQEYAANDSHSALAIYRVLEEKALNLTPRVEPEWFTFDAINGVLRDQQGFQWFPFNPLYDPGPLPTLAD
jgi:ribonuclease D